MAHGFRQYLAMNNAVHKTTSDAERLQTYDAIVKHGLMVRQVPFEVVNLYSAHHLSRGGVLVEQKLPDDSPYRAYILAHLGEDYRLDEVTGALYRRYAREVVIPKHPGWWMCKTIKGTGSMVQWSSKTDCLAPTLEESVQLWLRINKELKCPVLTVVEP